jgi:hypothetical protein
LQGNEGGHHYYDNEENEPTIKGDNSHEGDVDKQVNMCAIAGW